MYRWGSAWSQVVPTFDLPSSVHTWVFLQLERPLVVIAGVVHNHPVVEGRTKTLGCDELAAQPSPPVFLCPLLFRDPQDLDIWLVGGDHPHFQPAWIWQIEWNHRCDWCDSTVLAGNGAEKEPIKDGAVYLECKVVSGYT